MDQVTRVSERSTETIHLMLNDPSMGLYRLQEHTKRSLPTIVEKKVELQNLQSSVQGTCYDLDYSLKTIKSINWNPHFTIIQECLKSAILSQANLHRKNSEQNESLTDGGTGVSSVETENLDDTEQDPIEGFICPACMNVWQSQEELISHWAANHDQTSDTNDDK